MSVLAKVPKKQRIVILGVTGAVALFVLYRWYAARSAAAQPAAVQDPMMDGSAMGGYGGGGGGGGVDLSGIQGQLDSLSGTLMGLPTLTDYAQLPAIFAGMIPPPADTNTGGVTGGTAATSGASPGATALAASAGGGVPSWLKTAASKVKGTISETTQYGASYMLSSPGSGGDWHTYYTSAGKIARQVFVAKANANTTSHQGASVPGALQGNGAVAIVDHAVKSVAASVPKPAAGYSFIQDSGPRAGQSYNVVQKNGSNYRFYANGDKVKI